MKVKKSLSIVLVLAVVLCLAACGSRGNEVPNSSGEIDETIVIKYAHTDSEQRTTHIAAEWFKDYMNEQTDGKVKVEIYPNGQLGDDEELLKGIKLGTIQMYVGIGNAGLIAGEKANITELPFVYSSYNDWKIGTFEKGGLDIFNQTLEGSGLVCLDLQYSGLKSVISSKKLYTSMDDFKGFKIRVTPSDLNIAIWEALGASPTPVSWGEVYTSLSQGTIDGLDHSLGVMVDYKFHEVAKYITLTNHTSSPFTLLCSQDFLDSLPDDVYDIFMDGVKQMGEMQREMECEYEKDYIQILTDGGAEIAEVPAEMLAEMKEAVKPVYDKQKEISGADLVDAFLATGGNE